MASACVTNVAISPENFLDCAPVKIPSYGWLSPRISFSRELQDVEASKDAVSAHSLRNQKQSENTGEETPGKSDLEIYGNDFADFEFRLEDPVTMLPADELFSDGKLVPLQMSDIRQSMVSAPPSSGYRLPDTPNICRKTEISGADPYMFSPKAPTCSMIHWKQLLRLKKLYHKSNGKQDDNKMASSSLFSDGIDNGNGNTSKNAVRSLKNFLPRSSKSSLNASIDSSVSIPFLKDLENELVSISSSRLSLSSSSSGHEHDDIPRLSLDSDKSSTVNRTANQTTTNLPRLRVAKLNQKAALSAEKQGATARGGRGPIRRAPEISDPVHVVSADSPRMNPSGKIVFQSLERSSSSPSTFNGGPRHKHRGVERSYSAKVRITPVLNVPVLRGSSRPGVFGIPLFASQQNREPISSRVGGSRSQQSHSKNRTDRA